ncbi:MAG: hypothetical protein J5604_06620 [Bacteroidales bacterium]|nr:hypothetical protein [Bacteroidales bacterium]
MNFKLFKNRFLFVSMLVLSVLLLSCNKERGRETHKMSIWATYGEHAVGLSSGVGSDVGVGNVVSSEALAFSGTSLNAYWQTTDNIYVFNKGWSDQYGGSLRPKSEEITTQLKGTITGFVNVGDSLKLLYPRSVWSYTGQNGTIGYIADNYDYATAGVKVTEVGTSLAASSATFRNEQAVVKFTLQKEDGSALAVNRLVVSDMTGKLVQSISNGVRTCGDVEVDVDGGGGLDVGVVYVALKDVNNSYLRLTATGTDGKVYTYCKDGATFENGKYYSVTVKMQCLSNPLTLEATSAGTITFNNKASGAVYYKKNGGGEVTIGAGASDNITVNAGDVVSFWGTNETYAAAYPSTEFSQISCTAACYVYGNIMSLISKEGFSTLTTLTGTDNFRKLFLDNSNIRSHSTKKLLLPATTVRDYSYADMFRGCSGLMVAPDLPATTLSQFCYMEMFYGCSSLAKVPTLPARVLAPYCYQKMFINCTAVATGGIMKAETLANGCCSGMYRNCTSLVSAPILPVKVLVANCYMNMFEGCNSLNYVKCLATNISADNCTYEWLKDVAGSGTFVTPSTTGWTSGINGIPSGWTRSNSD